ncbi:hypothetical protein [Paenibacillus polymyxa]|uniref:M1-488 n=1 Tax=Paenibacillus polymyxa (strain SC2) TaxID=886882 RepID=E3ECJ2_PAEPS|nr:hypothetical protein [Paenibacillus polymyxa]ADO54335.1 M1-488 [Paenibacillus polymyxa SC2]AJE51378.1 hypothetical protein RE92_10190 [Paenibacillus polymyxa]QOH60207.1 hypothetical protein DI243_01530 [Paenibacillus polymyxa]WPQ57245.1 hypothetical protein SKN87_01725 [Paenibacillus polymyxa]
MKSTKKAILAGTLALAFLGGGALYSTSAAHAASTTPDASTANKAQAPKGNPGDANGPQIAGGNYAENKALLKLLKLSSSQLDTQLKAGKSLATIATAQGVSVNSVIDVMVSDMKSKLATEKQNGKITASEYNQRVSNLKQMITDMVNGVKPSKPPVDGAKGETGKAPAKTDAAAKAPAKTNTAKASAKQK